MKFKPAKIYKVAVEPPGPSANTQTQRPSSSNGLRSITGISFDDRGDQVITAGEDETFRLYGCKSGKQVIKHCYNLSLLTYKYQVNKDTIFQKVRC